VCQCVDDANDKIHLFFCSLVTEKALQQKGRIKSKKEQQIDAMTNAQVVDELKTKRLPTFGTLAERKERLKKHHGKFDQNTWI